MAACYLDGARKHRLSEIVGPTTNATSQRPLAAQTVVRRMVERGQAQQGAFRPARTGHFVVPRVGFEAAIAGGASHDILPSAFSGFDRPVRITEQGSAQADEVCLVLTQDLLGLARQLQAQVR